MDSHSFWWHVVNIVPIAVIATLITFKVWGLFFQDFFGWIQLVSFNILLGLTFEPFIRKMNVNALQDLGMTQYILMSLTNIFLWIVFTAIGCWIHYQIKLLFNPPNRGWVDTDSQYYE